MATREALTLDGLHTLLRPLRRLGPLFWRWKMTHMSRRIALPPQVALIYRATEELSRLYPGRPFTPDGHLVGSIGEVVAAEALGLTLYPPSHPGHDAYDADGDVQIKMTAGKGISMYDTCDRLVVLRVVSPEEAEIVYDGPGHIAWQQAGPMAKNGQRRVSLSRLRAIASDAKAQPTDAPVAIIKSSVMEFER